MSEEPVLRVVRGEATAEDVAALLAAVVATRPPQESPERPRSRWLDREAMLRHPPRPGPGAWRASGSARW